MSNIIDYMKWRGDLTFAQDSFNEIDNLILSQLVYVELNNIVPGDEEPTISLLDAAKLFFKQNNEQELLDHVSMTKNAILVFKEMAKSVGFKNVQLSRYVNDINEQEQSQFSAITIKLPDNSTYIAFSGTDATLVGWHEDFNMLYLKQTPGQEKSLAYLNALGNLDIPKVETSRSMLECMAKNLCVIRLSLSTTTMDQDFRKTLWQVQHTRIYCPLLQRLSQNPLWLGGYLNIRKIMLLLRVKIRD